MKIDMYTLLGLVKDGNIPKRIIYDDYVYQWNNIIKNYEREDDINTTLNWDYITIECLNEKVEIIEKNKEEKKIPEKLGYQDNADGTFYLNRKKYNSEPIKILSKKINDIIDYLEYLKSKGDE